MHSLFVVRDKQVFGIVPDLFNTVNTVTALWQDSNILGYCGTNQKTGSVITKQLLN